MNRLTWSKENGEWGVVGVELRDLPPSVYGALMKLKRMEDLIEQINAPTTKEWEAELAVDELLSMVVPRQSGRESWLPVWRFVMKRFTERK
jgi:hypothetical protein